MTEQKEQKKQDLNQTFLKGMGTTMVILLSIIGYLLNDMNNTLKKNNEKLEKITIESKEYQLITEGNNKIFTLKLEDHEKRILSIEQCLNKYNK
jgi:hypothetical protein